MSAKSNPRGKAADASDEQKTSRVKDKNGITEKKSKVGAKAKRTITPAVKDLRANEHHEEKQTQKTKKSCAPERTKTAPKQTGVKDLCAPEQSISVRKRTPTTKTPCAPKTTEQTQSTLKQTAVKDSCTPKQTKTVRKPTQTTKKPGVPEHTQTEAAAEPKPDSAARSQRRDKNTKILQDVLKKLTVAKCEKSEASKCINDIREIIIRHLKQRLSWCKDLTALNTGSYYENVKICEPDEFDVMLTVPVERVDVQQFSENGAFHTVKLKRSPKHPLQPFLSEDGTLRASEMLQEFRQEIIAIIKCEKQLNNLEVLRKGKGCPAVTLLFSDQKKKISIDFVLGLEVNSSWPSCTRDGFNIDMWLGKKEKQNFKFKSYYLVPKYEGIGSAEHDGVKTKDSWRLSFSHVEKEILRKHGKAKTCCESQKCCRKDCLKLLKYLLNLLKMKHQKETEGLCSYHAKTALFHACAERVEDCDWAISELSECFQLLLKDFEKHLRDQQLLNFFIPSHNLFKDIGQNKKRCNFLADCIKKQYDDGFPLFQEDLRDNLLNAASPEL